MRARQKLQAAHEEKKVQAKKCLMTTTGKQTSLDAHTEAIVVKRDFQDDLVHMFLCAGIPFEKMDHKAFRSWLAKTTKSHGCIPAQSGDFPRQNVLRLYFEHMGAVKAIVADTDLALMFDEWTDGCGTATIAVLAFTAKTTVAIDVMFLEGHGPACGVEHTEIVAELVNTMSRLGIDTDRIKWVSCDEGSVMVAAYNNHLAALWRKSKLILCMAHKLSHVGRNLQRHPDYACLADVLFAGAHLLSVPKNAARKRRWKAFLGKKGIPFTMPPQVGDTRWNAYADAANWWSSMIVHWKGLTCTSMHVKS